MLSEMMHTDDRRKKKAQRLLEQAATTFISNEGPPASSNEMGLRRPTHINKENIQPRIYNNSEYICTQFITKRLLA